MQLKRMSFRLRLSRLFVYGRFLPLILLFQNCSELAPLLPSEDSLSSTSLCASPTLSLVSGGSILYQTNCSSCHGALSSSTVLNKSSQQIKIALGPGVGSVPSMATLSSNLSSSDIASLTAALSTSNAIALQQCGKQCSLGAKPVDAQRITKLEYNNVIRDLFGLSGDFSAGFSAPAAGAAGFTTESSAQNLSAAIVLDFYNAASAVTTSLFALTPNPLLTCTSGDTCAKQIITSLTTKAFRRTPTADEVTRLFNLYKSSSVSFNESMKLVVRGVLMSPQFIFRTYDLPSTAVAQLPLTDYELASRLSFFIWGSIPDAPLLAAAAGGTLQNPDILRAQVQRMLKDAKASYLSRIFGSQWVGLNNFDSIALDTTRFPLWNASMKSSMKNETLTFMDSIFLGNQSVMNFLTANYTYADQNISQIYGVAGIQSTQFTRISLDQNRAGILSQPSILAMNSSAEHTSPVRRGKWVLDRILCSAPGAPPNDVPALPSTMNGDLTDESMIRQRMAQHRLQGTSCYGCHSVMDPVGLSFENFDSMGFFRTKYINGVSVDASGQLPTGEQLSGISDLAQILKNDNRFPVCFTAKLSSFAQGRDATTSTDKCGAKAIADTSVKVEKTFSDLVISIVLDPSFRERIVNY